MKNVSTLASPDAAERALRDNYGGLVAPSLLADWIASPSTAPGRQVSSPWPERIDVIDVSQSGDHASVRGVVVEATSSGEGSRTPVEIELRLTDGSWLITSWKTREPNSKADAETNGATARDDAEAAADVVRAYYRAIAARDYARAFAMWGSSGPPEQTQEAFAAGFADTATVDVKIGTLSRIEGAAGSRYITVPVTITATTRDGTKQRFEGTYTLRRAMVEGAPAADRRWHLYKAEIRGMTRRA